MEVLIIGSGNVTKEILYEEFKKSDYIICADGGAKELFYNNLIPNVIIGDLDSICLEAFNYFNSKKVEFNVFPKEKDKTDMEICVEYAISLKPNSISIIGATGTRLDHTIGNISLLKKTNDNSISCKIVDQSNEILLVSNILEIKKSNKKYVSILPFSEKINVTTKGLKYEIKNFNIDKASTIGISNEFKNDKATIKINSGIAIVIISKD